MWIYSLKRYNNDFKISQIVQKEKISYSSTTVFKIRDSTVDYSLASKYLDGEKDSQISKRSLHLKIEITVDKIQDKDLPSPSIGNNSKGNLFLRMRKAKNYMRI